MLFALLLVGQVAVAQKYSEGDYLIRAGKQARIGTILEVAGGILPVVMIAGDHTGHTASSYKADNTPFFIISGAMLGAGALFHIASSSSLIKAGKASNKASASVDVMPGGLKLAIRF